MMVLVKRQSIHSKEQIHLFHENSCKMHVIITILATVLALTGMNCIIFVDSLSPPSSYFSHFYVPCFHHQNSCKRGNNSFGRNDNTHPEVIKTSTVSSFLSSSASNDNNLDIQVTEKNNEKKAYKIRDAKYGELGDVAKIIVDAFYDSNILLRPLYLLKELDRLQSNFAYPGDPNHFMYVAVSTSSNEIIAFVDIDGRRLPSSYLVEEENNPNPPRPYLSDLTVSTKWRRQGIASDLIKKCESISQNMWNSKYMYLRVESKNEAAINMYTKTLGYSRKPHLYFGVKDTTMLLYRDLTLPRSNEDDSSGKPENVASSGISSSSDPALDYVV